MRRPRRMKPSRLRALAALDSDDMSEFASELLNALRAERAEVRRLKVRLWAYEDEESK